MDTVSPRWVKYYAENKEIIAARRKARRALKEKKPVDEDAIQRYNDIMAEAAKLRPIVALKKLRETLAAKTKVSPSAVSVSAPTLSSHSLTNVDSVPPVVQSPVCPPVSPAVDISD